MNGFPRMPGSPKSSKRRSSRASRRGRSSGMPTDLGNGLMPGPAIPSWVTKLLSSGEAVAYLSLSGNHAVALSPEREGTMVEYQVRAKVKDELIPVARPFMYEVLGVFGGGAKGRAVAFRPKRMPTVMVIAFRGVRVKGYNEAEDAAGPLNDRVNFLRTNPVVADWLELPSMRVHEGIREHHDSFWDDTEQRKGLGQWLASHLDKGGSAKLSKVVFCGLSFGGSLAQMSAYRVARQHAELLPRVHVLAFGSEPWANTPIISAYASMFGERSVVMVSMCETAGPPPPGATWWASPSPIAAANPLNRSGSSDEGSSLEHSPKATPGSSPPLSPRSTHSPGDQTPPSGGECRTDVAADSPRRAFAFDPLIAPCCPHYSLMPNMIGIHVPLPDGISEGGQLDSGVGALIRSISVRHETLAAWMDSSLAETDQFLVDYGRLHIGRQYREALVSHFLAERALETQRKIKEEEKAKADDARLLELYKKQYGLSQGKPASIGFAPRADAAPPSVSFGSPLRPWAPAAQKMGSTDARPGGSAGSGQASSSDATRGLNESVQLGAQPGGGSPAAAPAAASAEASTRLDDEELDLIRRYARKQKTAPVADGEIVLRPFETEVKTQSVRNWLFAVDYSNGTSGVSLGRYEGYAKEFEEQFNTIKDLRATSSLVGVHAILQACGVTNKRDLKNLKRAINQLINQDVSMFA